MTKYEPTNAEIYATETYQNAKAIAELIPIPEYSEDVKDYERKLDEYREICGDLNSSGFGRFTTNPSIPEFNDNLIVFTTIEDNLNKARALHENITTLITKYKLEEKRQAERKAIWDTRRQQDQITLNAYLVAKERLTQENKNKAKAERAKEREMTKEILKAN